MRNNSMTQKSTMRTASIMLATRREENPLRQPVPASSTEAARLSQQRAIISQSISPSSAFSLPLSTAWLLFNFSLSACMSTFSLVHAWVRRKKKQQQQQPHSQSKQRLLNDTPAVVGVSGALTIYTPRATVDPLSTKFLIASLRNGLAELLSRIRVVRSG